MARFITYLTLIPTIFTFIAIILINVGGVNPDSGSKTTSMEERNGAFHLLKWSYTVDPSQGTTTRPAYHLHLNRLCVASSTLTSYGKIFRCRNDRFPTLDDGTRLRQNFAGPRTVSPFRFDAVNMDIGLAFYIIAILSVLPLMIMAFSGAKSEKRRGIRMTGVFFTAVALVCTLIASSVLTAQMVKLRNQIRNDTQYSVNTYNPYGSTGGNTITRVRVRDVSLGKTFLGLTWASVVALIIELVMWTWAFVTVKNEKTPAYEIKKEQDGFVQG